MPAGAAILESGVHLTRHGVPLRIHDGDVARVTQARGAVRDLAHAHGVEVHVGTVNDPAERGRRLELGVDGIVSEHPARAAAPCAARAR